MSSGTLWLELREKVIFSLLTLLLTLGALALEFRYNYAEKAIGRYLAWHNLSRQESGQIWDTVSVSETVQQQLEDLVRDRKQQTSLDEQTIREIEDLIELVYAREKVILGRDQFLEMYNRFPLYQKTMIIEPIELLDLIGKLTGWQRTLIEFAEGNLNFYLIDGLNNVLEQRSLGAEFVNFLLMEKQSRSSGLDGISSFNGPRYSSAVFYEAWSRLDPQQRNAIPLSEDELIAWRYRLQRVAVNHGSLIGDRMAIGFELSGDEGLTTVQALGRSLAVLSLVDLMDSLGGAQQAPAVIPDSLYQKGTGEDSLILPKPF